MSEPSFVRGYWRWLGAHRLWIASIVLLAVIVFAWALWLSAAPQDPFAYEIF